MSNLNIYKSKSSTDLSSTETTPLEDGAVYFTNDTHEIYADLNGAREAYGSGGGGSALDKQQIEKNKQDILAKVSSNGGDVSDTVINTIEEETTQKFPIISPKDTIKKAIGKLKKWQTDMVADMGNYVLKSMIANQQINDQNKVPSSALAYTMNQQISKLNEDEIKDTLRVKEVYFENDTVSFTLKRPLQGFRYTAFLCGCAQNSGLIGVYAIGVRNDNEKLNKILGYDATLTRSGDDVNIKFSHSGLYANGILLIPKKYTD